MPVVSTPQFAISVHAGPTGVVHVCLAGEFDMSVGDALADALVGAARRPDASRVVVDLGDTLLIDSHAVAGLVAGYQAAAAAGLHFTVVNGRGLVQQVLDITGLSEVLCVPS